MTSCGTRFVGPDGEFLYDVKQTSEELRSGLLKLMADHIRGPSHHGSTMFYRSAYEKAGGYRASFDVAQDLDLWLRLSEAGVCLAVPEVAYIAKYTSSGISVGRREEQARAARVIVASARLRRSGREDCSLIGGWLTEKPRRRPRHWLLRQLDKARLHYFIGSCVLCRDPDSAKAHFRHAICHFPLHPLPWLKLVQTSYHSLFGWATK
jgi:hypothetical protein